MNDGKLEFFTKFSAAEWAGVIAAFLVAFERLARLTPTHRDDGAVRVAYRFFAVLGVKVPDRQ